MSLTLRRTAVHKHGDNCESVLELSIIRFEKGDGSSALVISNQLGEGSVMIHGRKQLGDLQDALTAVANEIWDAE